MARATNARDIALGVVVTGARAGATAGRVVLLPVRVAARTPVVGVVLRRAGEELTSSGETARAHARRGLESAADEVLAAPELERTVDRALAGPLTDAVARSVAEHEVVERVASEVLTSPELENAIASALDHEAAQRLVDRALASPGLERLVTEVVESKLTSEMVDRLMSSPDIERAVGQIASSPEIRSALARQTASLADEVSAGLRKRAERTDDAAERTARSWLRRPQRTTATDETARAPYAGIATRTVGFTIDILLAHVAFLAAGALLGLAASLVGELRPQWLVVSLVAAGWGLVVTTYFVLFWTIVGQTPGMRALRLRVTDGRGEPPRAARSLLRLFGLILAIVPLFAGFLPILFDRRRRGLQDYLAGTVVVYADRVPLPAEDPAPVESRPAPAAAGRAS